MFEIIISFFDIVLYQPLFNALIFLYAYLPGQDFGIAVIALTILIKTVLYPLGTQSIKSQKALSTLQPKIKEIQEKYKKDKEKQAKEMMDLYKREKINPLSGCFPLLIQLPILFALFKVFMNDFGPEKLSILYNSFMPHPEVINTSFLGIVDLAQPSIVLAVFTGILQFIQTKMITPKSKPSANGKPDFSQLMQKQMLYFLPIFTVIILFKLPSALALYWMVSTLFAIGQQYFVFKKNVK